MDGKGYETVLIQKTSLWRNRISESEACGGEVSARGFDAAAYEGISGMAR